MSFELTVTLLVLFCLLLGLLQERISAEVVMLLALLALVFTGVVPVKKALEGFANETIITLGALFVVAAGLQTTGAIETLNSLLLGRPKVGTPIFRLIAPVAALSGFMNNTPLVAFFLPIFVATAKKIKVSPSQLLIPLSYASILGGTCTLIGTSTNLTVNSELLRRGDTGFGMFELAWVGVPVALVGLLYLSLFAKRLLPNKTDLLEYVEAHRREYTAELLVQSTCPLIGKTIRQSGLRELPGLYLYAIERNGERLSPVSPKEKIALGDLLVFSGVISTVVDLQKIRGLMPVDHHDSDMDGSGTGWSLESMEGVTPTGPRAAPRSGTKLCEVVVAPGSPLVGRSVKEADFRSRYNASIIAVYRAGDKLSQKIGQIILAPGDSLLIDAAEDFPKRWRNSLDFVLVSGLDDTAPVDHRRAWMALGVFLAVVVGMTIFSKMSAIVAVTGAVVMLLTGCVNTRHAYRQIEISVLLLIAAALGVSSALDSSGAAEWIAGGLLGMVKSFGPVAVLAAVVLITGVLTELLSNNATAALMSVLVYAIAEQMNMDARPLLIAVTLTASYGFATPIGYQTNLMVLNPGGYRFKDYLRIGIPMDIICWTMTIVIIAVLWPLSKSV
jgi:di/tricarboxylate transporter